MSPPIFGSAIGAAAFGQRPASDIEMVTPGLGPPQFLVSISLADPLVESA